jgi:hypothetical protein
MKRPAIYIFLVLITAVLNSCATVHQIDRENLSTKKMQFEPEPGKQSAITEFHSIREGASGGTGQSAGGGCGCN